MRIQQRNQLIKGRVGQDHSHSACCLVFANQGILCQELALFIKALAEECCIVRSVAGKQCIVAGGA